MEPLVILDMVYGVACLLGVFTLNSFNSRVRDNEVATAKIASDLVLLTRELAAFREYVALNHPTHDGINRRFDKLEGQLDTLDKKNDAKFETLSAKMDAALAESTKAFAAAQAAATAAAHAAGVNNRN